MGVVSLLDPPATAALDTTFEDGRAEVFEETKTVRYIRQRPTRDQSRILRSESEPLIVTYHPEMYDKLNILWQQANDLITSRRSHPLSTDLPSQADGTATPIRENTLSQPPRSIVDWEIFRLLYNSQVSLDHFACTKQELPFIETIKNREFMTWVAAKEPGVMVNYHDIRNNLARLSQEQILRQSSPNVFEFFNNLLRAHDMYILRGARFLSFDLWMNMVQSYYGTPGDIGMLACFPVTDATVFNDFITTSEKAMSEESRANRKRNWNETHDQWQEAEQTIVSIKSSKEFFRRYDQLQKLMKIFRTRFDLRSKRYRNFRTIHANRPVDRRRVTKVANINVWREEVGLAVLHESDGSHTKLLQDHQDGANHQIDATIALPGQLQSMKIADGSTGTGTGTVLGAM